MCFFYRDTQSVGIKDALRKEQQVDDNTAQDFRFKFESWVHTKKSDGESKNEKVTFGRIGNWRDDGWGDWDGKCLL